MKNYKKGITPIIIALIVAVVLGGGYLIYKNTKVEAPTPVADISATDTANWKTYTNTQYGFSIQYPADSQKKGGDSDQNVAFTLPSSSEGLVYMFYVEAATQAWYNLGTPNSAFKSPANCDDFSSTTVSSVTTFNPVPTSSVNINGVSFIKGDMSSATAVQRNNSTEFCVVRGKIAYKLTPSIQYGPSYGDASKYNAKGFNTTIDVNKDTVLNQMLSTFKFIPTQKTGSQIVSVSIHISGMNEPVFLLLNNTTILGQKYLYIRSGGDALINNIDPSLSGMGDSCSDTVQATLEVANGEIEATHTTLHGESTVTVDVVKVISHDSSKRTCAD